MCRLVVGRALDLLFQLLDFPTEIVEKAHYYLYVLYRDKHRLPGRDCEFRYAHERGKTPVSVVVVPGFSLIGETLVGTPLQAGRLHRLTTAGIAHFWSLAPA